jgi:hypothetical protein
MTTPAELPFAPDRWLVIEISEASLAMRGIGAHYPQAKIVFVGTDNQAIAFTASHRVRHGHQLLVCPFAFIDPDAIDMAMYRDKINHAALRANDARAMRLQINDPLNDPERA